MIASETEVTSPNIMSSKSNTGATNSSQISPRIANLAFNNNHVSATDVSLQKQWDAEQSRASKL